MKITVKTFHGLEEILTEEIVKLGVKQVKPLIRAVAFEGNKETLYKANLQLRTALRVLVPVYSFKAKDETVLYNKIYSFDWSKHLNINQTFSISSAVNSGKFRHSKFVALKVKDAIADQFRKKHGWRPSVDPENADIQFNVYVSENDFTVSLDSSGQSLHRRGYRLTGHEAPLNEALAASMILLSGWNKDIPLIDPMCGSGTLVLEAGMIAGNIPPGIKRSKYAFMNWFDYDESLWKRVYDNARNDITDSRADIRGSDISSKYIELCKSSAVKINLSNSLKFEVGSFENLVPATDSGMVIMNPPYGQRITQDKINNFYKMIGDNLKQKFAGFDAWVLSSNKNALKHFGLRPSKKLTLYNGSLECKYQKFSLYKGSKKRKYQTGNKTG